MSSPFEAPSSKGLAPTGRPTLRVAIALLAERALFVVTLPGLLVAALVLSAEHTDQPWWVPLVAAAVPMLLWLPTSAVQLWARLLSPRVDPHAIVLSATERIDRSAFRLYLGARLVERAIATLMLVPLVGALYALSPWVGGAAGVVIACFLPFALLTLWAARHVGEATIAQAGHEPEVARRWIEPVLRAPLMRRASRDAALQVGAQASLRLGDVDGALEQLGQVRNRRRVHAALMEAQILVGRGETEPARALLRQGPRHPGERLGYEVLGALLAVEDGDGEALLARAPGWQAFRPHVSTDVAEGLSLYEAVGHAMTGDLVRARALLRGVDLDRRRWMARAWPKLWAQVERIVADQAAGS